MIKVAYLGPEGTFSEEVTIKHFHGSDTERHACETILDVLDAVQGGVVHKGVIPIENTIDGSINVALDRLIESDDLFVSGEQVLAVEQTLLGLHGAKLETLREIWSIPPALAQCHTFLRTLSVQTKPYTSTAAAAKAVADSGRTDVAAVASRFAAEKFGLEVLADRIQDSFQNHTRFLIIGKADQKNTASLTAMETPSQPEFQSNKTMLLVVPCAEYAGVLAHILNVFASFQLNLSWIVSRPAKTRLGLYQFVFDVDAPLNSESMQKSLQILRTYGHMVRVLGAFMKAPV